MEPSDRRRLGARKRVLLPRMRQRRAERRAARRLDRDARAKRRRELADRLPYLAIAPAPRAAEVASGAGSLDVGPRRSFDVATYNVHRWVGGSGSRRYSPELATRVIEELDVDVVALQEVVRPFEGPDPLEELADSLGLHLAFVSTRIHRRGELGNAILSRWRPTAARTLDLSFGRLEKRSAIAAQFGSAASPVAVIATHLALVDRTRARQVRSLLEHRALQGPVVLLGDLNAWRRCPATRELDREFRARHHNRDWPASFPAARPALALDRVYSRGAAVTEVRTHRSAAARRASDHLPVLARVELGA